MIKTPPRLALVFAALAFATGCEDSLSPTGPGVAAVHLPPVLPAMIETPTDDGIEDRRKRIGETTAL